MRINKDKDFNISQLADAVFKSGKVAISAYILAWIQGDKKLYYPGELRNTQLQTYWDPKKLINPKKLSVQLYTQQQVSDALATHFGKTTEYLIQLPFDIYLKILEEYNRKYLTDMLYDFMTSIGSFIYDHPIGIAISIMVITSMLVCYKRRRYINFKTPKIPLTAETGNAYLRLYIELSKL